MNARAKFGLLCIAWLLALVFVVLAATKTFQALQGFQQQYNNVQAGDAYAIRPWMTIQLISQTYHIPEDYLCSTLQIAHTDPLRLVTLDILASRKKQPVNQLIWTLQQAI